MTRRLPLSQLLPDVPGIPADLQVTGLVMDSRAVRPGDAFVAIAGFGAHGLGFVEQAHERGAAVILFEPPAPVSYTHLDVYKRQFLACTRSANSAVSTRRAKPSRTSSASPMSMISARKAWSWRWTTGCAANRA